jgi:hypothetical protein
VALSARSGHHASGHRMLVDRKPEIKPRTIAEWESARGFHEGAGVWGAHATRNSLSVSGDSGTAPVSAARREEHWTADTRRPQASPGSGPKRVGVSQTVLTGALATAPRCGRSRCERRS